MPLDLSSMWDFRNPALSEERFTAALATAAGDDALILRTQIARTWGLRGDFERARAILAEVEPLLAGAGAEPRVRHALELGRTHASPAHPKETQTDAAKEAGRACYMRALETAKTVGLDDLAIDVIHMMVMVDTAPEDQLRWNRAALALVEATTQPSAKRWEAPLRNNLGCAYWEMGRNEEALAEFQRALALREAQGNPVTIRIAHWMIAKTLRLLGRIDEALAIQERLEREWEAAGDSDTYVFEELALLHRARGEDALAAGYEARAKG